MAGEPEHAGGRADARPSCGGRPVIINHAGEDQEPERSRQIARPRSHEIAKFSSLLALIVRTYGCGQSKEVQTGHTLHIIVRWPNP
jgi:hypothetical protein